MQKIFIIFFISLGQVLCQNQKLNLDSIYTKIQSLENKLVERENELIDLKKNINFAFNVAVDAKDKAYKTERELWSEHFGWLATIVIIFSSFIGWFGLNKLLENKANTIFKEYLMVRLKGLKDDQITTLISEIESSTWKAQIRNKKVLVLNQTATTLPDDFKTAISIFNPEFMDINTPNDALSIDYSKYNLVILENYEIAGFWELSTHKDDMIALADQVCTKNAALIYYGDSRKGYFPENNINKHLVNFANSPSQLYNNVMNTLKFQDLLSKS